MILSAIGNDASIDLFDHHIVITRRRPGIITDRPSAEQFIPLSSIKSVQFIRPGFMARGMIMLTLEGGQSTKSGTSADENLVIFSKHQLSQFEVLLNAIREAIATPSIERMAMAAQRRQSVGNSAPPPAESRTIQVVSQPSPQGGSTRGSYDETMHYDREGYATNGATRSASPPPRVGGWWRDMPPLGKFVMVGLPATLLLSMCSSATIPPDDDASTASTDPSAAAEVVTSSAEAMLSDLTEYINGKPGTAHIAVTDGPGDVGEFCSASAGTTVTSFGGAKMDGEQTVAFDNFFSFTLGDAGTSRSGEFWFDRASQRITVRSVTKSRPGFYEQRAIADIAMTISQIGPGIITVDGVTYHSCVI